LFLCFAIVDRAGRRAAAEKQEAGPGELEFGGKLHAHILGAFLTFARAAPAGDVAFSHSSARQINYTLIFFGAPAPNAKLGSGLASHRITKGSQKLIL
jgi:hypothetical protein